MATKIRLQRHGKKRSAFYHIVIADARAKRDGRFIEKIGVYNPNTNPATIDLDFDRALYWVKTGAVPTDTARAILSYRGVLLKNHLDNGVKKGALTEAAAEKKFEAWMKDKDSKISGKTEELAKAQKAAVEKQLADEKAKKEAYATALTEKEAPAAEAEEAPEANAEEAPEGATAEELTAESEVAAETAADEAPAEEATGEEVKDEAPADEEAPAEDAAKEEE